MDWNLAVKGGLYGAIVGDALGVPVEFYGRPARDRDPVTDMIGYGTYKQPAGTWSDDSSMLLCLVDAINKGFSYKVLARNFVNWYVKKEFTPHGEIFDIGNTTEIAISNIINGKKEAIKCGPTDDRSCGNGSLMRILPLSFCKWGTRERDDELLELIENVSSITHGNNICKLACIIYIKYARELLRGYDKNDALDSTIEFIKEECWSRNNGHYTTAELMAFNRILCKEICVLPRDQVKSSGYCVDTLEAAIWCVLKSEGYKESVLKAVNLGNDTDTIACVTGGLAGIIYGYNDIPVEWINALARKEYLDDTIGEFTKNSLESKF